MSGRWLVGSDKDTGYQALKFALLAAGQGPLHHWQPAIDQGLPADFAGQPVYLAVTDTMERLRWLYALQQLGVDLPSFIAPDVVLSQHARIADACALCAGAVIQAGASLGKGCVIGPDSVVEHDCSLAAGVVLAAGVILAGACVLERGCHLEAGGLVGPGVHIAAGVRVSAGRLLLSDVPQPDES